MSHPGCIVPKPTFRHWMAQLLRVAREMGAELNWDPNRVEDHYGAKNSDAWRSYFDKGYSPDAALSEDLSNGD